MCSASELYILPCKNTHQFDVPLSAELQLSDTCHTAMPVASLTDSALLTFASVC